MKLKPDPEFIAVTTRPPGLTPQPLCHDILFSVCVCREVRGVMVSVQDSVSGFKPWPGLLCCILKQDTLLSQCLSPPGA